MASSLRRSVPTGTKSTLPDTLHHRDEVGYQPNDPNQHSRYQRFHRTYLQSVQSMHPIKHVTPHFARQGN
jgi:hypothetical protein